MATIAVDRGCDGQPPASYLSGYVHETGFQRAYSPFNWVAHAYVRMIQLAVSNGHQPEVGADG